MTKHYIITLIISFLFGFSAFAQEVVYSEIIDERISQNDVVKKVFSIGSTDKLSAVSLQIKGYDQIEDNVFPAILIKINSSTIFTGTLSDFNFGKNNKYGDVEFYIRDYIKKGNNTLSVEYAGLSANSFVYIKNISVVQKERGFFYKTIDDFNYNQELYTDYMKKTLTIESTVVATENYQVISKGMQGTYYGESAFNPKFGCVKWSKNFNKNVKTNEFYPQEYNSYAFNVPFAYLKINKTTSFGDNKPPLINSSVENYAQIQNKTVNISGRVTDQNGIYAIFVDGIKANIDDQGYYNLNTPLIVGTNSVKIKAFDNFGNYDTKVVTVVRSKPANDVAPLLKINYPQQNELNVLSNSIEFLGSANDDNNISYLQVISNKNVYKIFIGTNEDFKINLNLIKGENNIEIYAVDETGNESDHKKYKINFEPQSAKPIITLVNPIGLEQNNTLAIDKDISNLPITVMVSSQFPISSVIVNYINAPVSLPFENTQNATFSGNVNLPLASIINIKITATDIYNSSEEFSFVLKRRENQDLFPDIDTDIPVVSNNQCDDCYALIIGNAEYDKDKSLFNSLPYAANDVDVLKQYLIKTMGIPSLNIEAPKSISTMDFLSAINNFLKKIENHPDGKFLFYYSGHGALNKNQDAYMVPVDYNEAYDVYGIINNLVVDSVVYKMLLAQPAKLTVILDMCYSGKDAKGVVVGQNSSFYFEGPVVVFTASEAEAYSFKRRNHSLFTYALLKTIHDTKGNITYKDLADETQKTINRIIEVEKYNFYQNVKVTPSSVLDDSWETWTLP